MSFAFDLTLAETIASADLVLEGTIAFRYRDMLPGTSPRQWGTHWFLELDGVKVDRCPQFFPNGNPLNDLPLLLQLGFWTVESTPGQNPTCSVGENVTVHLQFAPNTGGYAVLTPVSGSDYGIVDPRSGRSFFPTVECGVTKLPRDYPALSIAYGILSDIKPWGRDLEWAARRWNEATGSEIQVFGVITNPTYTHYTTSLARLNSNLNAETTYEINGRRPSAIDQYPIYFNSDREWSSPGEDATAMQYDFRSIALHEIGHAMGLDHLSGSRNVMSKGHRRGEVRNVLQADDIDCMKSLLP